MRMPRIAAAFPVARSRLWQLWLRWRYRLFQRHRHDHLVVEEVGGFPILVLPGVFNPKLFRTGEFLAESLGPHLVPPGSTVLDMGTGTGIGGIAATRWARRVVAVDINPAALRCARINALLNDVEDRFETRLGDLFAAVGDERFDVVLFNPPFYPGIPRSPLEHAFRGGDVAVRFAQGLRDHLQPGGHALVLLSSAGETSAFLDAFRRSGLEVRPITERRLVAETLCIYRVAPARASRTEPSALVGDVHTSARAGGAS